MMKKLLLSAIALMMVLALACGAAADDKVNVYALKGPTGMGMAKLISDKNAQYNISIATAATEIAPLIIKG